MGLHKQSYNYMKQAQYKNEIQTIKKFNQYLYQHSQSLVDDRNHKSISNLR